MPKPRSQETKASYMKRCVPQVIAEGLSKDEAVGKCAGMFDTYKHKKVTKKKRRRGPKSNGGKTK